MKDNDWKKRLGMVYSTNPDFAFTTDDDLRSLSRELKKRLCTGGAEKDGQILIQGDVRQRLLPLLRTLGYTDSK